MEYSKGMLGLRVQSLEWILKFEQMYVIGTYFVIAYRTNFLVVQSSPKQIMLKKWVTAARQWQG